MTLRLVDCGIPSFEWKLKRVEIPMSKEAVEELTRKVEEGKLEAKKKRSKSVI